MAERVECSGCATLHSSNLSSVGSRWDGREAVYTRFSVLCRRKEMASIMSYGTSRDESDLIVTRVWVHPVGLAQVAFLSGFFGTLAMAAGPSLWPLVQRIACAMWR
jgi:hypothetical protein